MSSKAQDLARLALDKGAAPGEALNAAMAACRLILAQGSNSAANVPPSASQPAVDMVRELQRVNRDLMAQVGKLRAELDSLKNPPISILSKFASHCRQCGELIEVNERCWCQKGVKGVVCLACGHG